jgi:hypothetical protein
MATATRRARIAAAALGAALLCGGLGPAVLAPAARAETLRLENGRVMHGTVDRGFVDEQYMRIQLFSTGGVVKVRWDHLIPEDRDQWQVDLGIKESQEAQELKVDGYKVLFVNNEIHYGAILHPESLDAGPSAEVHVQEKGKEYTYARDRIARAEPMRLALELVYTPRQAYEMKRDEINPNNGQSHFDLADYSRAVGAYDEAKDHYTKAKEDRDFMNTPQGKQVDSKLATLEIVIRNQGLLEELRKVRVHMAAGRSSQTEFAKAAKEFLMARDDMFRLMDENPDKKVQAELKLVDLATQVDKERRTFFEKRMPAEVYRWLQKTAYDKAHEQKVKDIPPNLNRQDRAELEMKGTFEGARQYFVRQVREDLWAYLIKAVGASEQLEEIKKIVEKDPAKLTPEDKKRAVRLATMEKGLITELQSYWKDRAKTGGYTTSYGLGTFIVVPNDLKLTRKPPPTQKKSGGGGGKKQQQQQQQQQQQAVDVVKTPEQWWEEASVNDRKNWLLSLCAEKAVDLLEVGRAWNEDCDACGGLGYKKVTEASTGEESAVRCTVCNGAKVVRKVRWR